MSVEEYASLPEGDGWRDELSRGRLVREPQPGYQHSSVSGNIYVLLRQFVDSNRLGRVLMEIGCRLPRIPATVRGPDVAFVSTARLPAVAPVGFLEEAPDLAIEVVSPSNTKRYLDEKLADYFDAGVTEVWIVRPRSLTVDLHRRDQPVKTFRNDDVVTTPLLPEFALPLSDIFRD